MRTLNGAVGGLIVLAIGLSVAVVRYVLSDPIYESPAGARQEIPEPPPRPKHASERFGSASDGGRAIVRRSGRWLWVWIESEGTSDCRPGGSLPNGYLFTDAPRAVRHDGSFDLSGEVWNRWHVRRTGKQLPHKLDGAPFHISYRIVGRVDSRGAARGTLDRLDELHHDGEVAQACHRRSTWSATRSGPGA